MSGTRSGQSSFGMTILRNLTATVLALVTLMLWNSAHADRLDHDAVLAAVRRGDVRSLGEVLAVVARRVPGIVIEVELERSADTYRYEIDVLTEEGRAVEVVVDARTLTILEVKR